MTLTTPTGKKVEIRISTHLGRAIATAFVGGKYIYAGTNVTERAGLPAGGTHCFGPIVFDEQNAAALQAAIDSHAAQDPTVIEMTLREQRRLLATDVAAYADAGDNHRSRAWERGDERGGVSENEWDAKASAARQALRDFDAAHPEIIAAIDAERQRAADEAMWR